MHAGAAAPGARELLLALLNDPEQPNIARASGVALLGERLEPKTFAAIRPLLADPDPLLRGTAARALAALPPALKVEHLLPLLDDPVRLVRIEAARTLAAVPDEALDEPRRRAVQRGAAELIAAEMTNADRPESHLNIGLIHFDQGQFDRAEAACRAACSRPSRKRRSISPICTGSRAAKRRAKRCCARRSPSIRKAPPPTMR